ncbi:protein SENSITIVE TO PROTON RHIZOTOXICITY 1-like isoform X1 [Quillaja saponaria]|uniref:Protein SENSITIVE TO PROTON RHIZOTOXICITY 1-like isoform X1 n=1 Tax=Quillaja saponaria TaxID=32244 RepID=A0AAD7PJ99_QUISA|nr:protein SENSITIVE TO PROTON RHIZOTOXICITY 1-like isoform X1 [Quillaja saponaria]
MSVSLEALAMAGTSYVECAIDVEEWERMDFQQNPPPHLLLEEEEEDNYGEGGFSRNYKYGLPISVPPMSSMRHHVEEAESEDRRVTCTSDHPNVGLCKTMSVNGRTQKGSRSICSMVRAILLRLWKIMRMDMDRDCLQH